MHLDGLGEFTKDEKYGWYHGVPVSIPVLGGQVCRLVLEGYDEDTQPDDFRATAIRFLAIEPRVLTDAAEHVFRYYQDCNDNYSPGDGYYLEIPEPSGVWVHVQFGTEPTISRGLGKDRKMYVSLECNCDWEPEHGLQIVFENGLKVSKIGPYDGHMTNANADGDPGLEGVIYR